MSIQRKSQEEHEFDFVVIGGGLAGLCAGISAARNGVKTAIVQDRPVFGGNSSSEIRVVPLGSASFNAWTRETGILEEILLEERSRSHDDIFDGMTGSRCDLVLYEAARAEPNLTMFLNTSVRGVDAEAEDESNPEGPRRIKAVYGSQLASEKELVFRAKQFADCTGDATVGSLAGAEFRYGREARGEFNEPLAPVKADDQTMGSTLLMRAKDIGRPVPFTAPAWAEHYESLEEIGIRRRPDRFDHVDYGGYWWMEICTPYHQIDDNQEIKEELLKHVLGVWHYVKNFSENKKIAENYGIEWIGMVPGKRESRRLVGDVIVTEHDCHEDHQWPDRVCYSGWFIDLHVMGGILNKKEPGEPAHSDANYRNWTRIPPFSLPLRAFYSRNVTNLWMAGRNISVTHVALGSTRVMMTHALQGQAVGTAAAHAISNGLTPREAANPENKHIKVIQQQLLRDDVNVLGLANEDSDDLAQGAEVTATSETVLDFGEPRTENMVPLIVPTAQVFPVSTKRIEAVAFWLKNDKADEAEVVVELQEMEHIWDQLAGKIVAKAKVKVPANYEGWVTAKIGAAVQAGKPHRICLHEADGVSWARGTLLPTGTVMQSLFRSPGGAEEKNRHMNTLQPHETDIPKYAHWSQEKRSMAVRITPEQRPYGAANVNNGLAWPLAMPNLWCSEPNEALPQSVELRFSEEKTFDTVLVSFDTNLLLTYHDIKAFFRAESCARDWRLLALVAGVWKQVYEEAGNYHRRRRANFAPVTASALKLEILATNADEAAGSGAGVYEIRVYCEGR